MINRLSGLRFKRKTQNLLSNLLTLKTYCIFTHSASNLKMKRSIYIILLFLIIYSVRSQSSCLPNGIVFENQSEIDNFQYNYPGCTEIEGDVEEACETVPVGSINPDGEISIFPNPANRELTISSNDVTIE